MVDPERPDALDAHAVGEQQPCADVVAVPAVGGCTAESMVLFRNRRRCNRSAWKPR